MFYINDDMSIYITRGDSAAFSVMAENGGAPYVFQPGEVVRFKVTERKNCTNVVLQKDVAVEEETDNVIILLDKVDTKIGEVISKPVDYWYEVERNPHTDPQTIIGYDEDGAKIFKLFPEGNDELPDIDEEDIPLIDDTLSLTSERPIQNQAVSRAIFGIIRAIEMDEDIPTEEYYGMKGATEDEDGSGGFVPAPKMGEQDFVLYGDGTWREPKGGGGGISQDEIQTAVNDALRIAKESGEFDGATGPQGPKGDPYTLTETDKEEIAKEAASMVEIPEGGVTEETDPTVPAWAKAQTKPTYTKSEVGLGNVDNVQQYSPTNPPPYPVISVNGKLGVVKLSAPDVGADASGTASSSVSAHNTSEASHNDIRLLVSELTARLNAIADSDDTTLDQLSEIVAYIKANKGLIDSITTDKVNVADIINNLTTSATNKPLSAKMGVELKALIDAIKIPTSLPASDVPSWAKESTKPSYNKSEVGLGNVENVKQYSSSNPPPYPVTSVNGETGKVELPALLYAVQNLTEAQKAQARANIGATAPTKTSELENDSGFLTKLELTQEQLDEITEAVVESQTIYPAESVEWLNENGDASKKYVLPDGYIYAYTKKYVFREHNANDGTGYLNANAIGTWGNEKVAVAATTGMWTSPLIRIDTTKIAPVGNPEGSRVVISGLDKLVKVYYSTVRILYYDSTGKQIYSLANTQLPEIGSAEETALPVSVNLKSTSTFNDSVWSKVYAVRVVLGIKTTTITAADVANLKVNIPALNANEEVQGWFSTGVSYVKGDYSKDIENLQKDVDALMEAVGNASIKSDTVWYAIGDSITAGYGVGLENAWYTHVKKINGYSESSVNLGVSSIGFVRVDLNYGKTIRSIVDENSFANCDLVTVAVGINDWTEKCSVDEVKTEMRYCFSKILTDNPYCKIIFIAPFNMAKKGTIDTNWAMGYSGTDTAGGSLRQFIDAQKTVCEEYGVQVIDLSDCGIINRYNIQTVLYDNLHPNADGHRAIGKELARRITFA